MKQLSNIKLFRIIFYINQNIKFYILLTFVILYKLIKYFYKNKFIFILILLSAEINKNAQISNSNKNNNYIKKISNSKKDKNSSLEEEIGNKIENIAQDIDKFINFIYDYKVMVFVFYITYFMIKEMKPRIFFAKIDHKEDFNNNIFQFTKEFLSDLYDMHTEEEIKISCGLVVEIFNEMKKRDKIAEKIGVNYFFWGKDYIRYRLNFFIFKQMVFFKPYKFSANSKEMAILIANAMLERSRYHPGSKFSKFVCYVIL